MMPTDSSTSASSPYSPRSTIASSPETTEQKPHLSGAAVGLVGGYPRPGDGFAQNMQAMLNTFANGGYPSFGPNFAQRTSPPYQAPQQTDIKPSLPLSYPVTQPSASTSQSAAASAHGASAAGSLHGSHGGGMRSEPPKRQLEIEGTPLVNVPLGQLAKDTKNNVLLLQGDPQFITKQRVETAIRVILDFLYLRAIPPSPTPLPASLPSHFHPLLSRDPSTGNFLNTLARLATFRALRLQAGTTTKASSKKQLQAGPTPPEHLAYLETRVYMTEQEGKRVYVCKRCRMREARRRQSKEVSRKKPNHSGSESSGPAHKSAKAKKPSLIPPSVDYITGDNPDQYDPHRAEQVVEEPEWDPELRDWRHEIVLFNSPPEVGIKDGSCVWLPFRVVCYGKCHGEKIGFKIKFTIRTHDGREICSATTNPIRITDDHKTDAKAKPKADGTTNSNPAVPRGRKGRGATASVSAASSRRQSPAPSEVESVQSVSEAGAVVQKQTPQVRQGKPYERPSMSPMNGMTAIDAFPPTGMSLDAPAFNRQNSGVPVPAAASISASPVQLSAADQAIAGVGGVNLSMAGTTGNQGASSDFGVFDPARQNGIVSPGALRRPPFSGFTQLDGTRNQHRSSAASTTSSSVASPTAGLRPLDDSALFQRQPDNIMSPTTQLMSALNFSFGNSQAAQQQQASAPMLWNSGHANGGDVDMSGTIPTDLNALHFDTSASSAAPSLASSFNDSQSQFSLNQWRDSSSALYSDSGVVPEQVDDGMNFLDFSAGEGSTTNLNQPMFPLSPSLPMHNGFSPRNQLQDEQINEMLSALSQQQPSSIPALDPSTLPLISNVIPADGPMAGGTKVVVLGERFSQGLQVMFGERTARLETVTPSYIECIVPPAVGPGVVEVTIQGVPGGLGGGKRSWYKYNMMDSDLMLLALQVKDQYQGSSSDAAYRLAQHVAARSASASASEYNSSPSNSGVSPQDAPLPTGPSRTSSLDSSQAESLVAARADLQATVIDFLASLDTDKPGSLRRSNAVNHRNVAKQSLLHVATVMGYHRLLRRLVFIGAHLDLQDTNGYTPLALASLTGQAACARVLIEAGAAYDRPTLFGEMPLDLAKVGEHDAIEALLLSAVWSTEPEKAMSVSAAESSMPSPKSTGAHSEIDDDNPSDSEGSGSEISSGVLGWSQAGKSRRIVVSASKGKQRASNSLSPSRDTSPRASIDSSTPTLAATPADAPPPYTAPLAPREPHAGASWMSRTLSNISHPSHHLPLPLPFPSFFSFSDNKAGASQEQGGGGWVAFPAPSWEMLQKMASPDEVRLFTQAMAAAAFSAVMQGGNAGELLVEGPARREDGRARNGTAEGGTTSGVERRKSGRGHKRVKSKRRSESGSPGEKVVKHVKSDRMLYLFWLPILLFVGFWLLITALPLATGFCLIYARQITRAIKQRV